MALTLDVLSPDVLRRLHPSAVEGPSAVRTLLARLHKERATLQRGLNREIVPEIARIERLEDDRVVYRKHSFGPGSRPQLWLNFDLEGRRHFFASEILDSTLQFVIAAYPDAIYRAERRDRSRRAVPGELSGMPREVELRPGGGRPVWARVTDFSASGLGILAPDRLSLSIGGALDLRFLDGRNAGEEARAQLRHKSPAEGGWQRLGVSIGQGGAEGRLPVLEARHAPWVRVQRAFLMAGASAVARSERALRRVARLPRPAPRIELHDFANEAGERIRAIVDRSRLGSLPGAPVVVIPPAWGRTKETLLPLAATITAMFDAAGEAVSVVRFDGIRKRGESYNDPSCRRQGAEHHRFTFSQGIRDIHAVVGGLRGLVQFRDSKIILVTFSAASIDGRRAIATDSAGISGWVSVVGSADLQSMMRVVSGGVDYVAGVEQGLEFGLQEILGVEVDIGLAGKDALRERIAFLEDACRDLQGLTIPISWIHGRFDAWMDLERARLLLASGDPSNRRLIIVPTGHQLRTSREALEVFQLVAAEIGRMALGREISNRLPGLEDLSARRAAERSRLPRRDVDRRSFWRTYLLGRDGSLGIELMTSARAYRSLMAEQVEALQVKPGDWIADIGSGTGSLLSELSGRDVRGVRVHELDYIKEALLRARSRSECAAHGAAIAPRYVACDLGGANGLCFPYRDGVFDSVLASLFISYVDEPQLVLREIRRVLKPRGRLVMSGLRRDADVSKLFTEAIAEMQRGEGASRLKESGNLDLSRLSRQFLNDATRLMDLEEEGFFEFRDSSEMERLLRDAGFTVTRTWRSFGDPPQAVAVVARRGD